jgi:integrase
MHTTGWRKSEVLGLTVANVDLAARTVILDVGSTKSGEGRTIVITDALHTLLTKQMRSIAPLKKRRIICPYIFHRSDRSPITSLRGAWETATDAAGYPAKILHDFRRTAVRNLKRAGVPRTSAMKIGGHKTEAIYRRCSIQDVATLRDASAKSEAWTGEQRALAKQTKAQVKRFKKRAS